MADAQQLLYWDSCCFLEYLDPDSLHLSTLEAILDEVLASKGKSIIITSAVSHVEVAYSAQEKAGRVLLPDEEDKIDMLWGDDSIIKTVEVHELIVRDARALIRDAMSQGLSLQGADAIHLATAARMGAQQFCTYDGRISGVAYEKLTGLAIAPPHTDKPRLPGT